MRIYVGNLSYDTTEDELRKDFAAFGEVASVSVVTDRYSGRSKGFAFVEMTNKAEADAAIAGLNGKAVKERTLVVNEARPRTEGGGGGGRSGGYGGGGYGGGGVAVDMVTNVVVVAAVVDTVTDAVAEIAEDGAAADKSLILENLVVRTVEHLVKRS